MAEPELQTAGLQQSAGQQLKVQALEQKGTAVQVEVEVHLPANPTLLHQSPIPLQQEAQAHHVIQVVASPVVVAGHPAAPADLEVVVVTAVVDDVNRSFS